MIYYIYFFRIEILLFKQVYLMLKHNTDSKTNLLIFHQITPVLYEHMKSGKGEAAAQWISVNIYNQDQTEFHSQI